MNKLEIKGNVGTSQYGIIVTKNSKIFFQTITNYVVKSNNKNLNVEQIYIDIERIWQLFKREIYSDIENAGEDLDDLLCFNGEIIIDGEHNYFEFY
jgi:hypothetical protein